MARSILASPLGARTRLSAGSVGMAVRSCRHCFVGPAPSDFPHTVAARTRRRWSSRARSDAGVQPAFDAVFQDTAAPPVGDRPGGVSDTHVGVVDAVEQDHDVAPRQLRSSCCAIGVRRLSGDGVHGLQSRSRTQRSEVGPPCVDGSLGCRDRTRMNTSRIGSSSVLRG